MQRIRCQCSHRDEHENILWNEERREMLCVARSRIDLGQENLVATREVLDIVQGLMIPTGSPT
jgi:hypothetical protein